MGNRKLTLSNRLEGLHFTLVAPSFRKYPNVDIEHPKRETKKAAAYDFFSPLDIVIQPNESFMIWTDYKAIMPEAVRLDLNVRSSMGKYRVTLANTIGWIDPDYANNSDNDGNIGVCLLNNGSAPYVIKKGDRFAQGSFSWFFVTDDEDVEGTQERTGGFGSTND